MDQLKGERIGFIGGGNMAFAIASGLLKQGVIKPQQIVVSATRVENLTRWKDAGVESLTIDNYQLILESDIIFLCIKPHVLKGFCSKMLDKKKSLVKCSDKILVSILAGVTLERLENEFKDLQINVVRSMPNTPMQVGAGCTVFADTISPSHIPERYSHVQLIFDQLGISFKVEEDKIDGITGLAGCGPAYVYEIIEALSDGGVKQGIPREMAIRMAAQTVMGAAKTVLETGKHPAVLKDEVCSPGGATIYGVHELEKGLMRATLISAVEKASQRAKELQK